MKIYELNELQNPEELGQAQDMIRDLTSDGMLQAGPPYPKEDEAKVRQLQQSLQDLGYDVGSTGVDGKYGPRTTRAVRAFKTDYNLPGSGLEFGNTSVAKIQSIKQGTTPKKRPTPIDTSAAGGGEIGPMPTFGGPPSTTSGPVGDLLDMIAKPESGGRYDSVYPGRRRPEILDMTLNELYADMRKRARRSGSSASGRYQYIRKTLMGVTKSMGLDPDNTKFSSEVQDKIVIYHLRLNHGLDRWLRGKTSDEAFLKRLSKTWAGLPKDMSGRSYYAGDKIGNKAGMPYKTAMASLQNIRSDLGST